MDPGWPANPTNTLICILCKSAMPYQNRNPERFFRHLLADHCTYFNLNLLLEISLMQPHAVREESQPVPEGVQNAVETVLDQAKVPTIKKERNVSSSNLVEPDSTSPSQDQFPTQLASTSSSRDNPLGNISLEETCQPSQPYQPAGSTSTSQQTFPIVTQAKPPLYHNLQPPVKAQPKPGLSGSDQLNHEDISDFDLSFFINQITQPDPEQPPSTSQPLATPSNFIPFESKPSPFLPQSQDPYLHDIKPYTPNMYTMTVVPDFSSLDPISFVKQEPRSKRKITRQATVNKNNQPIPCLPDNPNRHLVPEDLQMLIYYQNPTRGIKFTYSQRMNTQMVVDDYVLKKKKGPYLTRGGRVVNWKCINDYCQYTAVTWEGQIQDTARQHNHPSQPELYVKKQARVKIRENMAQEVSNVVQEDDNPNPVTNAVMDVVTDTNPEMRDMIGSIDALKQAARRYNRKLHKDSQQQGPPPNMLLAPNGEDIYVPTSVYDNYEVVGEFPADYQFSVEVSDQVGHYTEVSTAGLEAVPVVSAEMPPSDAVCAEEVPAIAVYKSEQVTVEEETGMVVGVDATEQVIDAIHSEEVGTVSTDKVRDSDMYPKDDVEELLEPSPTKEDPLKDEFNC